MLAGPFGHKNLCRNKTALKYVYSTRGNMKISIISTITGFISLLTAVFSLIKSISDLGLPNNNITIIKPGIWIIFQFILIVYGNIAFAYNIVIYLNNKYFMLKNIDEKDLKRALLLLISSLWIPAYIVWMLFTYFITNNNSIILKVFIPVGVLIIIPLGLILIAAFGMLMARVIRPELPIKLRFNYFRSE